MLRQEHEATWSYLGRPEAETDSLLVAKIHSPGTENKSTNTWARWEALHRQTITVAMCLDHKGGVEKEQSLGLKNKLLRQEKSQTSQMGLITKMADVSE